MRNRLGHVALMLMVTSLPAAAQGAPDAVAVDPAHHHVLFENDHVRVFRALASPGARSPMHSHPPFVFVGLATARLQLATPTATNVIFDVHPEQVLWMENAEHSWEMIAGQAHIVAVEVKAAKRGTIPRTITIPATDATTADATSHHVVLENDYVRVLEVLAPGGARSPMHSHSRGAVIISLGRVRSRLAPAGGESMILDLHPGQVLWIEPGSHSWEIVGGMNRLVVVEVKSAAGGQ
ncbi:MAG: hypothetical protein ACSLFE_12605 [Gemmatimonadaceae bacterium]